nr:SDR family NAD(P)-dependent oxidoreductase [Priestia megaterium]
MSLPTYPFLKQHYWVPEIKGGIGRIEIIPDSTLHPLLHQNTSDLSEQRYSSTFTGKEFYLADHIVNGQRVLPGVSYLEMARAAIEQASGALEKDMTRIQLQNVIWTRPVVVSTQPVQVHTGIFPKENGQINFEVYSDMEERIIHSQGCAVLTTISEAPTLDLEYLKAQCNQSIVSANKCYEIFTSMGLEYGKSQRGIDSLYIGEGQILAKLCLPSLVVDTVEQFYLHPTMMDSALQAAIGFMVGIESLKPSVPFALQEVNIFGPCTDAMWALVRYSGGSNPKDKVQKLDIDLCDAQGNIRVSMKGYTSRVLEDDVKKDTFETLALQPNWIQQNVTSQGSEPDLAQRLVMFCEIETQEINTSYLFLQSDQVGIEDRFQAYALQAFEQIKIIMQSKFKEKVLVQIVIPTQQEQHLFAGLTGLLKTAQLENPNFIGQLIEVDSLEGIDQKLEENCHSLREDRIRYQDGKRWVASWTKFEIVEDKVSLPWKDGGVYLLTGGVGGLSLIFAKEIIQQVQGVTLILVGRSSLKAAQQDQLYELESMGARVEYKQVDVTHKESVMHLFDNICESYGTIHGILHTAGVIRDNFIIKKTKDELEQVLAPKVKGLVNLDQASKEIDLDFFILFSSVSGGIGNIGQADYSTANAFMDSYATYRNGLVSSQQRKGHTLSINWPLWKEGGMKVDQETEKMMMQSMGMIPMRNRSGIRALYQGLASGKDQLLVIEGKMAIMKKKLFSKLVQNNKITKRADITSKINNEDIKDRILSHLMQTASQLLKVHLEEIHGDVELSEYGFDSITFTEFSNKINEEYKIDLTPTIFFEYPTLYSFAEYLSKEYESVFTAAFAESEIVEDKFYSKVAVKVDEKVVTKKPQHARSIKVLPDSHYSEPIAIIGISGKFPMAQDVNEFWHNLVEGKDCITQIPKKRWDWKAYYGDPRVEVNKTNIKWGGFIEDIDEFDPLFFGISPQEAKLMDPQQRLLMTYAWKAIEDAGYSSQSLSGTNTGIFVGTGNSGYSGLITQANVPIDGHSSIGVVPSLGPNRMSYFLNTHGPSEPIETACSSSLIAIHRAVSAIQDGSCEMAIVGGVNTIVTPEAHISFNHAGMLCEDGRCKTFSNQANGYVRGEGVGMISLKKVSAAERDGDHIYGVIRGTAENHGGHANSLTAPNPKAQTDLLISAYKKAGVDPRTVTYIETHGTGTELGDPIEITGLKNAFKKLYQDTGDTQVSNNHCGIGSVKTNIGHLELAAGIAGVIKVLLQLKHKTLVPTIHCSTLNPYIKLQDSPFYIVKETKEWKPLKSADGREIPRRAGISSFGFGGVNAHVVIEEYVPKQQNEMQQEAIIQNKAIIVLSARDKDRLKEQVQQWVKAIGDQKFSEYDLTNVAYTLQVGRDAMEERLVLIVNSLKEMQQKLQYYLNGQDDIVGLYCGKVKRVQARLAKLEATEVIDQWIASHDYTNLAVSWIKGAFYDWNKLYKGKRPQRISLPTYPFAKEHYWVSETLLNTTSNKADFIHPLVQQNTSDLNGVRFDSTFTGKEFFISDFVMEGKQMLPGVAYLEMARAAVEQATGVLKEDKTSLRLRNVIWKRPVVVEDKPVQVRIELKRDNNGNLVYEINNKFKSSDNSKSTIYSQGIAVVNPVAESPSLNIEALLAQCDHAIINATECYEAFQVAGVSYGPTLQGIEQLFLGDRKVLAKLSIPSLVTDVQSQFILHPSLIDAALQASIGFLVSDITPIHPIWPITIQELDIYGPCTDDMWVLIRSHDNSTFSVNICDNQGKVCVRMKGYSASDEPISNKGSNLNKL